MALKKPAFETNTDIDTTTTAAEAPQAAAPAAQPEAAAKVEATTAIAKAASTSVATVNEDVKRFQEEFDSMRGAADFSHGNYKVFKAVDGEIRDTAAGANLSMGRHMTGRLLAWDFHWQVTPGTDGAKAKEFVAFSDDGETIASVIGEDLRHYVGKTINEYLDYLRSEGFDKAECKKYLDTSFAVIDSEAGKHEPGTIVQVTFSPSSIPSFNSYQEKLKGIARGMQLGLPGFQLPKDPFTLKLVTESASKGSNRWTKLNVEPVKG